LETVRGEVDEIDLVPACLAPRMAAAATAAAAGTRRDREHGYSRTGQPATTRCRFVGGWVRPTPACASAIAARSRRPAP